MQTLDGDVFKLSHKMGGIAVIGANCTVNKDGNAVMGRGAAAQAARLFPNLPHLFGTHHLSRFSTYDETDRGKVYYKAVEWAPFTYEMGSNYGFHQKVMMFIVKQGWWEKAKLEFIDMQCSILHDYIYRGTYFAEPLLFTKLGCGNGKLDWKDVQPIIEKYFGDYAYAYLVDRKTYKLGDVNINGTNL